MEAALTEKQVLEVNNLSTRFYTERGVVRAVENVSFSLAAGQTLGLVGESGCGKSVTARSLMGLIEPPGSIVSGEVWLNGRNLLQVEPRRLEQIRGRDIAMVFQDPLASLNPVLSIGLQLTETLRAHEKIGPREAGIKALKQLDRIGLPDPERVMRSYSFELSGGMCQRVVLAMALLLNPGVLIIDEPTTALDTTIQIQILSELKRLQQEMDMALVMITHDMGVIAAMADAVSVMYAGSIVETAPVKDLFDYPAHPYTRALLRSIPRFGQGELVPIEGQPPSLLNLPPTCAFYPRCSDAGPDCRGAKPGLIEIHPGHRAACCHAGRKELLEVSNQ